MIEDEEGYPKLKFEPSGTKLYLHEGDVVEWPFITENIIHEFASRFVMR